MAEFTRERTHTERRVTNPGHVTVGYVVSILVLALGVVLDTRQSDVYPRVRMMHTSWSVVSIPAIRYESKCGKGRVTSKSGSSQIFKPVEEPEEPHFTVSVPPLIDGDGSNDWSEGSGPGNHGGVDGTSPPAESVPNTVVNDDFADVVTRDPGYDARELASLLKYPEIARRRGVEGLVIVRATIDATGAVLNAVVVESENTLLDEAALDGIRKLHFTPADIEGKPVVCRVHIPVRFALR